MKLIIDIPKDVYEECQGHIYFPDTGAGLFDAVKNGTPLDSDSEQDEVQAYFAGMSYGWEEGRKSLIDDVEEEIRDLYVGYRHGYEIMADVLQILDNIGKSESEDKE